MICTERYVGRGLTVFGAALFFCLEASAGTIASSPVPAVNGPGLGFAQVAAAVTISPNNDDVPAVGGQDNNIVVPLKRFDSLNYIDIKFTVALSEGVTEYKVSEFVDNNTGANWGSYNMYLGFGTGDQFQLSGAGDGLDFDAPLYTPAFSSGAFFAVALSEDTLVFSGGTHGSGAQPYVVRIDVPDLALNGNSFTLRQIPTAVPEPGTALLAALS